MQGLDWKGKETGAMSIGWDVNWEVRAKGCEVSGCEDSTGVERKQDCARNAVFDKGNGCVWARR